MLPRPLVNDRITPWHFLAAGVLGLAGVLVTFDAWREIFEIAAADEEASHIFLVIPIAVWLIWVRRTRVRHCRPTGMILGPILVLAGWLLYSHGFNHGGMAYFHLGALLVVGGSILSVLGKGILFRFLPAFAVLVFLIPVPRDIRQSIALPLQGWTANIAQATLELMGVETEISGNLLSIHGTAVTIAEACNGMRMVFALILISYAFSFGLPLKNGVRVLLLVISPLVAIACNVVRTLPTIWLYGYKSRSIANTFHDLSGWMMLPLAFLLLLGMIRVMKWLMLPVQRYTLASQ